MAVKLQQNKEPVFGKDKCPVYLKLLYIVSAFKWLRTAVQRAVYNGYHNAIVLVIFKTQKVLQIRVKMSYPCSLRTM